MPGIGTSLVVFAVGAVLYFAITVSPYQHGFNVRTVGLILMVVAAIGFILSIIFWSRGTGGWGRRGGTYGRRRTRVMDDGRVVQDDYYEGGNQF